ncbi:hypothetical protein L1D50_03890 [Pseudoalteromonas sp. Isolate6]|uniref:hypothetical protein n=1 Tax=Pseudoalteromonas sp. Isolate6 TaxID=2908527 RepID=UPI001EFCA589|nr:hypothetical protein [Pseudoalteromonas sp. Isolate6]MCG9758237.1 hypothetical protein [Pseudoalteromonas sp. Isolate6]
MSNDNLTMTERLSQVATRANALCQTVEDQVGIIQSTLSETVTHTKNEVAGEITSINNQLEQAEEQFNQWKGQYTQEINGLPVTVNGNEKSFFFRGYLSAGSYSSDATGPDSDFPRCGTPKPPYYVNMLEFDASGTNQTFGEIGDWFSIDCVISHRGMIASAGYGNHFIFTGTTSNDCVSGLLEIKKVSQNGAIKLYISEPDFEDQEIAIDKELEGSTIPIFFRRINQGYGKGVARISLKIDTRYHCGASRAIAVSAKYSSDKGQPCVERLTHTQPSWEQ